MRAPGAAASIAAITSSVCTDGPPTSRTGAPAPGSRAAATKAAATSGAYCSWYAPPNGRWYGASAAAASIATVGADVSPWSRAGP